MKYYTLTAQVLAKIVFYNLLPKSGEYSHARGSAPLVIYCLLRGIRINIPKLIISYMISDHLLVPNRHLPFGMIITHLLKQLNIDLSSEWSVEPTVDINSTLLKRMRARSVLLLLSRSLCSLLFLSLDPPLALLLLSTPILFYLLNFGSTTSSFLLRCLRIASSFLLR